MSNILTKTLIPAFIFALVSYFGSWLVFGMLFHDQTVGYTSLFRAVGTPELTYLMPLGLFLTGVGVTVLLSKVSHVIPGTGFMKGFNLGMLLFVIIGIGEAIMWYGLTPVSMSVLVATMVNKLITYAIGTGVLVLVVDKLTTKRKK